MAVRTESRITIAGSVPAVFAYLCDVGRWPEWAPTVLECRVRGGAPLQPGARVDQRAKLPFGLSRTRSQQVTAVDAPRSVAFAGPMGTSAARWGMELEPAAEDGLTEAMMWIEVDLGGVMRAIPGGALQSRIQRVSDQEMVAIKAAVESAGVGQADGARERLIEGYRRRARRYDVTSQLLYPVGRQRAHRRRAIEALRLRPGDSVVEIACGTGLNFGSIEQAIGPEGRILGVDLTDAMLDRARQRIEANGWSNVTLVQADAAEFEFPRGVDAILATYPHALLPDARGVIAHGAEALSADGRWVVLDLKIPDYTPRWLTRAAIATAGRSGSLEEWAVRRPWEAVHAAMRSTFTDLAWTELFFGIAYIAAGSRPHGDGQRV